MKPLLPLACLLLSAWLVPPPVVQAQAPEAAALEEAVPGWQPGTGDDRLDGQLRDIDRYVERHRETFIDELVRYQGADRGQVSAWLDAGEWHPGELYLACAVAVLTGRACAAVLELRAGPELEDWASLLEYLEAPPGSPVFVQLQAGVVASYRRWGRPL